MNRHFTKYEGLACKIKAVSEPKKKKNGTTDSAPYCSPSGKGSICSKPVSPYVAASLLIRENQSKLSKKRELSTCRQPELDH